MTDAPEPAAPKPSVLRLAAIFAPVAIFAVLAGLFASELLAGRGDALPSALISRPAPVFDLPPLRDGARGFATADLKKGEVAVVNLWASWCGPCRVEHPELMRLAEMGVAKMYALNYRDQRGAAIKFLDDLGDPFDLVGFDDKGMAGLRWGVTGVPETFVVAGDGRVIYKHVGPINPTDLERLILPAIEAAKNGG